jgi:hypothetical protein
LPSQTSKASIVHFGSPPPRDGSEPVARPVDCIARVRADARKRLIHSSSSGSQPTIPFPKTFYSN